MNKPKPHVSEQKKKVVKEFVSLLNEYPIVAVVNMENLPAKQLQNMRASLRGKVVIKVSKGRLMKIALSQVKDKLKGIEKLTEYMVGMPGMLFTKENPFSMYKTLQKSKSSASAKPGQIAPKDIIVKAGKTNFAPGPIIGELGSIGLKTTVDGGKVAIKEDVVVVKEGQPISLKVAGVLSRLGVEPMEIGLNVTAVYEDGNVYTGKILAIDEKEYINNIFNAHRWAFNLAMEAKFMTKETTTALLQKAHSDAFALAISKSLVNKDTVNAILQKVHGQMMALKQLAKL